MITNEKIHPTKRMSGFTLNNLGNKTTLFGWLLIPNCSSFDIELKGRNPLWKSIGIDKNIDPKITIKPANNRNMNKYLLFQIRRLQNCTDKYKYWTIC